MNRLYRAVGALCVTAGIAAVAVPAHAATARPKAGAACKKVGERTSNGLVCVAKGKSKVYQAAPKPTVTTARAAVSAPATSARPAATVTTAAPVAGGAAGTPKRGGVLKYSPNNEIISWKPWDLRQTTSGEDRGRFIYDTLMFLAADGTFKPNIALSLESTDAINWTMKLRPGVVFSDGTPLDAEAVKWNTEQNMIPANGNPLISTVSGITNMTVVNATTLNFVLAKPNGTFPYGFTSIPGMMASPTAYKANPAAFGAKPVGAGPFVLTNWVRDSSATLVRNPSYWDKPKPYLDGIDITIIVDPITRGQAVVSGQVDIALIDPPVKAAIKGKKEFKDFSNPNSNGAQAIVPNQSRSGPDDVRIREAVTLAFDQKFVNDSAMLGTASGDPFSCPPFTEDMVECVKGVWPKPNIPRARQLVQDYAKTNTLRTYDILINTGKPEQAQLLQQVFGDIGLKANLTILPTPEYLTRFTSGSFDFAWSGIVPFDGPAYSFYRNIHSKERFVQKGTPDPALDKILDEARVAVNDSARLTAAKAVQEYNAKDFTFIFYAPYVAGVLGTVKVNLGDMYTGGICFYAQNTWKS